MPTIPLSLATPLPTSHLITLANSGAFDEISNYADTVTRYILNLGLVKDGVTRKALFFVVYQTGMYGPQNGFRLVLVNQGYKIGEKDVDGEVKRELEKVSADIGPGIMEWVMLGEEFKGLEDISEGL